MTFSRSTIRLSATLVVLIAIIAALGVISFFWVQIPFLKFQLGVGECKWGPPLAGVYAPERLNLGNRCQTASGIVDCLKEEPDGDIHVRLRLDPQFANLLRPANALQTCADHPSPHLVVEIIPQHPQGLFRTNNADAGGFVTPSAPRPGDHIVVTGPYVIDTNILHRILYQGRPAENWAEIHPAWAIKVDHRPASNQTNQPGPDYD
jgi:hypothetical protein